MGWVAGYSNRKQFDITGSTDGPLFDYVLSVTVMKGTGTDSGSTIYLGTSVQDDFEDVRFTAADGTTLCTQYRQAYTSGTSATYYVTFPKLRSHPYSSKFYVYYGNPTGTLSSTVLTVSTYATVEPYFSRIGNEENKSPVFRRSGADNVAIRLVSGGKDYGRYVLNGNVERAVNQIGQATIQLSNKHGLLNSDVLEEDDGITVHLSRDNGLHWYSPFTGSIITRKISQDGDGSSLEITAVGTPAVRHFMVSPNQLVIGPCEVGTAFTGTTVDAHSKSWTADANGNYPNGLLYKTGYSYSAESVQNIYTGSVLTTVSSMGAVNLDVETISTNINDIPREMILNRSALFDAIESVKQLLALSYHFDDEHMEFKCYRDPNITAFPTASVVLSEGTDLISFNYGVDASQWYDKVTVIGKNDSIYYTYGTGSHEYILSDDTVKTREAAKEKATSIYNIFSSGKVTMETQCPPIDANLLGYYITLSSERHSLSGYGNVISQKDSFRPGAWNTALNIDNSIKTIPKVIKEIKDEMKEKDDDNTPCIYLNCIGHPTATTNYNVCAIGIGSSSDTNISLSQLVPVIDTIKDTNSITSYAQFYSGSTERVREIVVFGNTKTDSDGDTYEDYLLDTKSEVLDTEDLPLLDSLSTFNGNKYRRLCRLDASSESYVLSVESIEPAETPEIRWINMRPNTSAIAREYKSSTYSASWDAWDPTSTNWAGVSYSNLPANMLVSISSPADSVYKSEGYGDVSGSQCLVHFYKFDTGLGTMTAEELTNSFNYGETSMWSKVVLKHYVVGNGTVSYCLWNRQSDAWTTISTHSYTGANYSYSYTFSTDTIINYLTTDSNIYMMMKYVPSDTSGVTNSVRMDYIGIALPFNSTQVPNPPSKKNVYEFINGRTLIPWTNSDETVKLEGIFLKGSVSDDGTVYPDFMSDNVYGRGITQIQFNNSDPSKATEFWVWDERTYDWARATTSMVQKYWTSGAYFVWSVESKSVPEAKSVYHSLNPADVYIHYLNSTFSACDLYIKCSSKTPVYGTPLSISYKCIDGAPVARFVVSSTTRIDQGVSFPSDAKMFVCSSLDYSMTNEGPGTIRGIGVELGRPL